MKSQRRTRIHTTGRRIHVSGKPLALALLASMLATTAFVSARPASGLRYLGKLPAPREADMLGAPPHSVFLIDDARQRLYSAYNKVTNDDDNFATWIREYDLRPSIPRYVREGRFASSSEAGPGQGNFTSNVATHDTRRNHLIAFSNTGAVAGCPGDPFCGSTLPAPVKLFIFDLTTLKRIALVNIHLSIPGFMARGITYSREDDRLYVVGLISPGGLFDPSELLTGQNPRSFPTVIAALEPSTGKVIWVRPVTECGVPMSTGGFGVTLVRSESHPVLYFACVHTGTSVDLAGIVRVLIDPKASQTEALDFPIEFLPISGNYANGGGISGSGYFDYAADRFYMQSQSDATPGTWVFDGSLSAWVGFVGAPDTQNAFGVVNQRTGRYYMGGRSTASAANSYVVLADGRNTPVPQGRVLYPGWAINQFLFTDSATNRLFVNVGRPHKDGLTDWLVYEDDVPVAKSDTSLDYDSLTDGVPEGRSTFSAFSGSVNGFGAQLRIVGGFEGFTALGCGTTVSDFNPCSSLKDFLISNVNFSPSFADRALFVAQVPSLDLRNVGASAQARALALDQTSDGEYQTLVNEAARRVADTSKNEEAGDALKTQLAWPHREDDCLDAGDGADPKPESGPGGGSSVGCDLAKNHASASTSFGAFAIDGVSVAASSFVTDSIKDAKLGVVTTTTAIAKGVEIALPNTGTVKIGRVMAVVKSAAHGMKGTATIDWRRTLEGVSVHDAAGKLVFACADAQTCDPKTAIAAMNDVLKTRVRIDLPTPEKVASPGGAFAGVQESEGDFFNGLVVNNESSRAAPAMQITVFNDGDEKSRLLVQLAAIQASSIYGISTIAPDGGFQPPLPVPIPTGGLLLPPPIVDGTQFVPPPVGGPVVRIGTTALFLIRSPKDALLLGLTILLLGSAVASVWRRRVLVNRLQEP